MGRSRAFIGNTLIVLGVAFIADTESWWRIIPMVVLLAGLDIRFGDDNG